MLLHTNPTRERGECLGTRAGASEDMQGLRTTFPWVFWGFHGKYKIFI